MLMIFLTQLLDLVHSVRKERSVPKDWANAVLVPIYSKGRQSHKL